MTLGVKSGGLPVWVELIVGSRMGVFMVVFEHMCVSLIEIIIFD